MEIGAKGHAVWIFFTGATARYVWVNNAMAWDQARLTCISTGKIFKLFRCVVYKTTKLFQVGAEIITSVRQKSVYKWKDISTEDWIL